MCPKRRFESFRSDDFCCYQYFLLLFESACRKMGAFILSKFVLLFTQNKNPGGGLKICQKAIKTIIAELKNQNQRLIMEIIRGEVILTIERLVQGRNQLRDIKSKVII